MPYPKSVKEGTGVPFKPSTKAMLLLAPSHVNPLLRRISDMYETGEDKLAAILDEAAASRGAYREAWGGG